MRRKCNGEDGAGGGLPCLEKGSRGWKDPPGSAQSRGTRTPCLSSSVLWAGAGRLPPPPPPLWLTA